jgi:SSS family solute:Na+ symporter
LTDTIQSIILLGGVILSLILITIKIGGVSQWWPHQWNPNWVEPKFGYDPKIRVTMVGALITWFSWYVCTAGSDQMAIQRYLSTRNIQSARRAQLISLIGDSCVGCLLCVLGLAIFAYFTKYSHLVPQGWTIADHADELFPHFIVVGLPVGVTGLVISGLLAASMSSLSSGINSSCLVISEDFIARFRKKNISEQHRIRLDKIISFLIGVLVIILSTMISQISGNIFAITYKAGNLLVAPLFVPFFMALFVRFSKSTATFIGTIISVLIAITISFWEEFTGNEGISFLWILPFSFIGGALVSVILSLITNSLEKKKLE